MLTYRELQEQKLADVAKMKDYNKMKDVLKTQHGVELGDYNTGGGGNYRNHSNATISDKQGKNRPLSTDGRPIKTVHVGGAKSNKTTESASKQIVQMVKDSGRVNKSVEGKKRRKEEMKADLEKKKARRAAPFSKKADGTTTKPRTYNREHSEWWLNMWRIDEATEEQIALQKQRQADRVAKGGKGAEGSGGTHFHQGQAEKNRRIKQGKAPNLNTTSTPGQPKKETPRGVSPSEASRATSNVKGTQRTAGLGRRTGQTGTTREATGRQKGGDLAKRPVTSTSPGAGALAKRGEVIPASGGQKPDRKSNTYRQANKEATPKPKKPENQFMSGLKTSMGGDVFSKNDAVRKRSRRDLGKKTGNAIKSVPGKAVSAGRKALDLGKKSVTDGPGSSGPDSVQGSSEIVRGKRAQH